MMALFIGWLFERRCTLWDCFSWVAITVLLSEGLWFASAIAFAVWIACGITGERRAQKLRMKRGLA